MIIILVFNATVQDVNQYKQAFGFQRPSSYALSFTVWKTVHRISHDKALEKRGYFHKFTLALSCVEFCRIGFISPLYYLV